MIDIVLKLIGQTETGTDQFLQPITTKTETEVIAASVPVSRSEFYQAGQLGINPEFEFIINPAEYSGEKEAELTENGTTRRLRIYRTYERNADEMELYCTDAAGLNPRPAPGNGEA